MKAQEKIRMQLACPMPKLDYDKITLGHGSGGVLTHRLLDDGVFDLFKNQYLDKQHDGAIFQVKGPLAMTTDSFVVSPVFFPGGNIGELAVNGTVNDVAMCGAIPKYLSLAFIIEEGLKMEEFWEVLTAIKFAADEAGVQIITGDTKVVERGKGDKIYINTTGVGEVHPQAKIEASSINIGDKIIVSGQIATHGMAIMSVREGLQFETDIESDTQGLNHITQLLLDNFGNDIHFFRDPTRGGLGTTLSEIVKSSAFGIDIQGPRLPIDKQVASACEMLGLDPLYVANEGVFVAFVSAKVAPEILELLKSKEKSKNAAIIGEVTEEQPGKVILHSAIGGKRLVKMLSGEQLPRIC